MALINPPGIDPVDKQGEDGKLREVNIGWRSFFNSVYRICSALVQSGSTAQRPTELLWIGKPFWDETLGQFVYWNGTMWVTAPGDRLTQYGMRDGEDGLDGRQGQDGLPGPMGPQGYTMRGEDGEEGEQRVLINQASWLDLSGASNGQVKFPATQNASADANTLDDYEEGTCTYVLTFATPGDLNVVYSTQVGHYTKIGNTVNTSVNIITSTFTHTTASGNAEVTGVPFTSANVTGLNNFGALMWQGITTAGGRTDVNLRISANETKFNFISMGSALSASNIGTGQMPTGGTVNIRGSINFQV